MNCLVDRRDNAGVEIVQLDRSSAILVVFQVLTIFCFAFMIFFVRALPPCLFRNFRRRKENLG